jgi:hypothetical protein
VNRSTWPAPEGVLAISIPALDAAIESASAAGWDIGSISSAALIDTQALQLAIDNLPAGLDVNGDAWTPIEITLPLD